MEVDYTHLTETSEEILKGLKENGIELKPEDKQLIIEKVYEAITEAYNYESNGCDCGQVWCSTCGG